MIRRGEIYWVDFRGSVGAEIRKVRPAVVVSSLDHNEFMQTLTVVPLSSENGKVRPQEVPIPSGVIGDGRASRLATHQVRAVDKSRVGRRIGVLPARFMPALNASLLEHLGID
ncbi:MAG: type II toxin-antitoxin system PemK/MazF family toxin [Elusimicrobiota bacterium]